MKARGLLATVLIRHARLPHRNTDNKQRKREWRDEFKQLYPILQYIDTHFPFLSQKFVPPCLIHNNASISG